MELTSDIKQYFKTQYQTLFPGVDFSGSVVEELFLNSAYTLLEYMMDKYTDLESLMTFSNASGIPDEMMDKFAGNFGLTRIPGARATGNVRFYRTTIPSSPINIPSGTLISSVPSFTTSLQYSTTESVPFSTGTAIQDVVRNAYYVEISAEAIDYGTNFNVESGVIVNIDSDLAGFTVLNVDPISGGVDREDNAALMQRITQVITSGNNFTENGIKSKIQENFPVTDLYIKVDWGNVVSPSELYSVPIFIYVKGTEYTSTTANVQYYTGLTTYSLGYTPLNSVGQIVVTTSGGSIVLTENVDYTITYAEEDFRGSTFEGATLNFTWTPGNTPVVGTTIDITYTFNRLISDVQAFMDASENQLVGSNVIVIESTKRQLPVLMAVYITDISQSNSMSDTIKNTIISNVTALGLGASFVPFKIIDWTEAIDGVVTVDYSTFSPTEAITLQPYEELYTSSSLITLTIKV